MLPVAVGRNNATFTSEEKNYQRWQKSQTFQTKKKKRKDPNRRYKDLNSSYTKAHSMLRQLENSRHTVMEVRWSLKTADFGLHLERSSSAGSSCCLSQHHFTHPIMLADCKKVRFLQQWCLFLLHNLKYHIPSPLCTCQGECDEKVSK